MRWPLAVGSVIAPVFAPASTPWYAWAALVEPRSPSTSSARCWTTGFVASRSAHASVEGA